jgi:hypothetical protein
VEVRAGKELLILDAGTGIRKLGLALGKSKLPIAGTLLISHVHWVWSQCTWLITALEALQAAARAEVARRGGDLDCVLAAEGLELQV